MSSVSPLENHREAHSARGADSHQAELSIAALELVQQRDRYAGARSTERVAEGNRSAHYVETRLVHHSHRLREARALRPRFRLEASKIREHLRRKRLMHLHEIHVPE